MLLQLGNTTNKWKLNSCSCLSVYKWKLKLIRHIFVVSQTCLLCGGWLQSKGKYLSSYCCNAHDPQIRFSLRQSIKWQCENSVSTAAPLVGQRSFAIFTFFIDRATHQPEWQIQCPKYESEDLIGYIMPPRSNSGSYCSQAQDPSH